MQPWTHIKIDKWKSHLTNKKKKIILNAKSFLKNTWKITKKNYFTLLLILELNANSCLNRFKWIHSVSGNTVTREYLRPFLNFLPNYQRKIKIFHTSSYNKIKILHFSQLYMLSPLSSSAEKK